MSAVELSEMIKEGEVTKEDIENDYTDFVINVDRKRWFGIKAECEARGISFVITEEHLDNHGYFEMVAELVQGTMHYRYAPKPKKFKHVRCR